MSNKHMKPLYWGIFSAGGTVAALALAPLLLVFGILMPLGVLGNPLEFFMNVHGFVSNKFVYLVLVGLTFTILWHGVHRLYYLLHDLHIHVGSKTRLSLYAFAIGAFLLTLFAGWK